MWVWVAVFAAGFGVGYALMSTFVSDPESDRPQPVVDAAEQGNASDDPSAAPTVPDPAPETDPGADLAPPAEVAVPTPPTVAMPDTPEPAADPGEQPDTAAAAEPEPAVELPWWEACRGRVCRVDFHKITGGLSIRKGQIEHGSQVSWDERFGGAARVAVLGTERRVDLELRAVGMGPDGQPSSAEIGWKKGGRKVVGVISLDLGGPGKRITMRPPPSP